MWSFIILTGERDGQHRLKKRGRYLDILYAALVILVNSTVDSFELFWGRKPLKLCIVLPRIAFPANHKHDTRTPENIFEKTQWKDCV